jgi:hypothetical protein
MKHRIAPRARHAELQEVSPKDALAHAKRYSVYREIVDNFWASGMSAAELSIEWMGNAQRRRRERNAVAVALRLYAQERGYAVRVACRAGKIFLVRNNDEA